MSELITAPWTAEQVEALNAFQQDGFTHPFTCGNDRMDEKHRAYQAEHGGDYGQLVATPDGWICPSCDYRQDWAHAFMDLGLEAGLHHEKTVRVHASS